ncbi:unnamed protein product, partial [Rotaria magnacalcarata]
MGGLFGRNKKTAFDPNLPPYGGSVYQPSGYSVPPPYPYGPTTRY